jgi:hypothetical protein
MSKSMLFIDTPDCCDKCPLCRYSPYYLSAKCRAIVGFKYINDPLGKPKWCPLREVSDNMKDASEM